MKNSKSIQTLASLILTGSISRAFLMTNALALDGKVEIYLGSTSMKDAIASGKVKVAKGDADAASAIFEMFDSLTLSK